MRPENKAGDQNQLSFIEKARRAQIVECAIDTIATLGYAQASLAQIAKNAGISKGVISYHFPNKEAMIQQVVMEIFVAGEAFMRPRLQAESDAPGQLRAYIESNVEFLRTHRKSVTALMEIFINARSENGASLFETSGYEPVIADLEAILKRGQKSGEFRKFSTRVMALAIRAAIDALPPQMTYNPDLDLNAYARELVTLFDRATRRDSA